jgi:hypothetical protein
MKKQRGFVDQAIFFVALGAGLFMAGTTVGNEPHYSLRDGCNMKNVPMNDGSGNRADSYAHCKELPRVYNGKAV